MSDMNDLEYVAYLRNECQPLLTSPDMRNLAVGVYLGELIDRLLESNAEIERLREQIRIFEDSAFNRPIDRNDLVGGEALGE